MPITFLNSQPSPALSALAHFLGWQGNGRCMTMRDPALMLQLACMEASNMGVLASWVDEAAPGKSVWLRLVFATANQALHNADFAALEDTRILCSDSMECNCKAGV